MSELTPSAPHSCPECGQPGYLGFNVPAKCTNRLCRFWDQDTWVRHIMELPDDGDPEMEIEDEDTQPFLKLPSFSDLYANKGHSIVDWLEEKDLDND